MPGPAEEQNPEGADDRADLRDVSPDRAFRRAWAGPPDDQTVTNPELLPVRLARACVDVLGVDGAGMSFYYTDFRVPIGASDDLATVAERLQFTQGEGPCLEAAATHRMLIADAGELESRWPAFSGELFRLTPFRAIVSLPLALTPRSFAALDLFLIDAGTADRLPLTDVYSVSNQATRALAATVSEASGDSDIGGTNSPSGSHPTGDFVPAWITAAPAQTRAHVWVAMGMVMTKFELTAGDAIALLRSFAYGRDLLLDDLAGDLVEGRIGLGEIQR
jgi:hypothetical protein